MNSDRQGIFFLLKRLYSEYLYVNKSKIIISCFLMVVTAISGTIMVLVTKPTIDEIFIQHNLHYAILIPILVVIVSLIKGIAEYYRNFLLQYVGQRLVAKMQLDMYSKFINSSLETIEKYSTGKIISNFTNDIILMRGALLKFSEGIAKHFISVLFCVGIMFYTEPVLAAIVILIFPLALYPIHILGNKIERSVHNAQNELAQFTSNIQHNLKHIIDIKSYSAETFEINREKHTIDKIFYHYVDSLKYDCLSSPIMEILFGLGMGGIIIYGGIVSFDGISSPGAIFAFILAFSSTYRPFKSLVSLNIYFREGIAASKRIFALLDIQDDLLSVKLQETNINKMTNLTLQNVSYQRDGKDILKDINIDITAPSNIAIIGRSGSGKTSLANIVAGLYRATKGSIVINNIKNCDENLLKHHIIIVAKNSGIYDMNISDNISYPLMNQNLEQIKSVARLALAKDFIEELRGQYNYNINFSSLALSSGQVQRIAIARALYRDPDILILDEATNFLDSSTEQALVNNVLHARQNQTNIIVTHNIQSIQSFDMILVIKDGKIVESGNHQALLNYKGEYCKLLQLQE